MNVSMDENFVYVNAPITSVRNYLVNTMGATYSKAKDHCKLPRVLGVLNELWMGITELKQDKGLLDAGYKLKAELDKEVLRRKDAVSKARVMGDTRLRPYQAEDVIVLSNMEAAGVFNEPRTGKTPTIIEALKRKGTKRNLIVAPASLLWTWATQIRNWYPEAEVYVLGSKNKSSEQDIIYVTKAKLKAPAFLIVSKNSVEKYALEKHTFDTITVDEAHFLRNYKTAQSKAIYKLKGKSRYALTGTPTVSHPSDIYGILRFLYPKRYTSFWGLCDRYFMQSVNPHSGGAEVGLPKPQYENELKELVGLISVSRKRAAVMPWLPAKDYKTIHSPMGKKQEKYYREMEKTFFTMAEDYDNELDAPTVLSQLTRLRQLAIDPRLNGFKEKGCKTEALLQVLKDRENDTPVVVMSMFTSYLEILREDLIKEGYSIGSITGQMPVAKKQETADRFQRGEIDVLLCNIITAGTGWTLDRGNTVIFMDNSWNPADNEQAEDRVTPTTKDNLHDHNVVHISTIGSVDEKLFQMLDEKRSLTDILNNGAREAVKELMR